MKRIFFAAGAALILLCCRPAAVSAETQITQGPGKTLEPINLYKEKEELIQVFSFNNTKIKVTEDDIFLMAQVVYGESRAEPFKGKVAVASVIINRLLHPDFPKTVEGVIKQRGAFSCVINGKLHYTPDESSYKAVIEALKGNDPTGDAVFFYNPKIATSDWMKKVTKNNVKPIGNHVFFVVR